MSEGKLDVKYEIVSLKGSKNGVLVVMYSSEALSQSFKVNFEMCLLLQHVQSFFQNRSVRHLLDVYVCSVCKTKAIGLLWTMLQCTALFSVSSVYLNWK